MNNNSDVDYGINFSWYKRRFGLAVMCVLHSV